MHNLGTVYRFEVIRTLKKKSFWLMSLAFPVAIAALFGVIYFSNQATMQAAKDLEKQKFSLAVTDEAHIINPSLLAAVGATQVASKSDGEAAVRAGTLDGYIYVPQDLTKNPVEVYGKDVGVFEDSRYGSVAQMLLSQSATPAVDPNLQVIIKGNMTIDSTYYRDGRAYDPIKQMIAPGVFLILLYLLIITFGNQMLVSTTEEKENRVIEMILTTVRARTLVVGKILSLVSLGFIQSLVIIVPVIIGYMLFHERLSLPNLDLSSIPLDPARITAGAVLFIVSFIMFTGLLVTIGAATPTAKEAGGFFGIIMILLFGPLYAAPLFISNPSSPFVQFMSYFPLTAPIPLLLRNAVGNLEWWQFFVAIAVLLVTTALILAIAVRIFRHGALEYSRRVSLKSLFSK